jgi:fibronectin-binding autotransporter adhesin
VIGSGTSLDLVHQATIGTITATPAAASIITGGSTAFGITVQNSAPTSSSALSAGAASGSNTTGSIAANTITTAAQTTGSTYSGLSFSGTTVGASQNGTFTVSDANADNSPQTGTVTVNVFGHASGSLSGSTLNIGNVHVGYTAPVTSSNSVTASNTSGFLANLAGSGSSGNESLTSVSGVAAGGTSGNITATLATGQGVGNLNSVVYTFGDSSALSGASNNVGTATVTVSGQVYSGTSTWTTNGGGTWGTLSSNFGSNWGTNQGSPGLDSNFKTTDSATFGGAATSGTATVTLGSASPSLNAVTFNNSAASYDIEQGGGGTGTLHLASTTTATVTVSAGSHVIGAPVELDSAAATSVAGSSTLTINGVIGQSGSQTLAINGAGTTVLNGANTFSGGTAVNNGTLQLGNTSGSATGTGSLTVSAGGTVAGYGSSSGTGFSISGTGTATGQRANVQVGMNSATDTNTTHTLSLIGSATSTITNANLTFNISATTKGALDGDPTGSGTELNVGTTKVGFGTGLAATTLTLDVANEPGVIAANTPYVLIAGSLVTGGGGVNGSQYTGLSLGATLINNVNGITETIITGNNLQIAFGSSLDQSWYGGGKSYLVLYQNTNTNVDDIDVVVVPEPGTWALMIGGLATLIFWQRSKRNRKG